MRRFSIVGRRTLVAGWVLVGMLASAGPASARPTVDLASGFDLRLDGAPAGQQESGGLGVAEAGDVNGDGRSDTIVSQGTADNNARINSGSVYVIYGRPASPNAAINLVDTNGGASGAGVAPGDGFRIDGAAEGNRVGLSAQGAGDVNGDGLDDVIVGRDAAPSEAGSAYVIYGRATAPAAAIDLADTNGSAPGSGVDPATGFAVNGAVAGDTAGSTVSGAGDVNADGVDDVVVGAPDAENDMGTHVGSAYVLYGRTGSRAGVDLADTNGAVAGAGVDQADGFAVDGTFESDLGSSVSEAGDVNADGFDDVVIGADTENSGQRSANGGAYVIYGGAQSASASLDLAGGIAAGDGVHITGSADFDFVGRDAAGVGDVNGDGRDDVTVDSLTADNNGRTDSGSVYVVYGRAGTTGGTLDLASLAPANGFRVDGAAAGDFTGTGTDGAGDINGDQRDDLIIGGHQADNNGRNNSGSAYVLYGSASAPAGPVDLADTNGGTAGSGVDAADGFRIDGASASYSLGGSVAGAGDTNGDGRDDVLVGSGFAFSNSAGTAYVVYGTEGAVNTAPVAVGDSPTVSKDAAATNLDVLANDTDSEGDRIRIAAVSDPANGSATVVKGRPDRVAYTPDPGYCNDSAPADTFTYTISRGATATVSVAVRCAPFIGFQQGLPVATTAVLETSIFTGGAQATWYFEYGPTSGYGQTTPVQTTPAGYTGPGPYRATISGLTPSTTYHFRTVAAFGSAVSRSPDATFTTRAAETGGGQGGGGGGAGAGGGGGGSTCCAPVFTPPVFRPATPPASAASAALSAALAPTGPAAKIAAILKAGTYSGKFTAPGAGKAAVLWYLVPKGAKLTAKAKPKPVLVAAGSATATRAGPVPLKLKLTGKGKALLKKAKKGKKKLKLVAKGTYAVTGGAKVSKTRAITLKP